MKSIQEHVFIVLIQRQGRFWVETDDKRQGPKTKGRQEASVYPRLEIDSVTISLSIQPDTYTYSNN